MPKILNALRESFICMYVSLRIDPHVIFSNLNKEHTQWNQSGKIDLIAWLLVFDSVANSLKPNMANGIENYGHHGQIFSQIWPKYSHYFSKWRPYLQFLLHFYVTIFVKVSNWKRNFTKCFLKTSNKHGFLHFKENLKILKGRVLEKFVLCSKLLWMCNWKAKFGQDGPKLTKNGQKWAKF